MFFIESSHSGSEDPLEFLKNRKAGAQETAKKAKEKGRSLSSVFCILFCIV